MTARVGSYFPGVAALAASLALAAPAQARTTEDEQLWINATAMGAISGKFVYFAEVQPRFGDNASHMEQLILRPAIGYKITPRLTIYQGFAHVENDVKGSRNNNEERSFQQISWTPPKFGRLELTSRTRFEQRWRSDGDDTALRVREMLRFELPLQDRKHALAALGSVEGFFGLNDADWGPRSGFDQIRTFAGFEVPVGKGASTLEIGYLNQAINQTLGRTRVNHVASISLFIRH